MSRARKPKAPPPPPPTPEQLALAAHRDAEHKRALAIAARLFPKSICRIATYPAYLGDIQRMSFDLPAFQRGYVWSRDQARGLIRRLFQGYPPGLIVQWARPFPDRPMLMDGQQRLVTLGAKVFRDGTPVTGHTVYLDWTGTTFDEIVQFEPGPTRLTIADLCGDWWRLVDFDDTYGCTLAGLIADKARNITLPITTIGELSDTCTYEQAAQIFRCYNSGGTPIDPDQLPPEPTL